MLPVAFFSYKIALQKRFLVRVLISRRYKSLPVNMEIR